MKIMLTSFGITDSDTSPASSSPFFRMPPVNMRMPQDRLVPDFATLVLCDRFIMDEGSLITLKERAHPSYSAVAETLIALHKEGFVELLDYRAMLKEQESLLHQMLEHDLSVVDQWLRPLRNSQRIWEDFIASGGLIEISEPRSFTALHELVHHLLATQDRLTHFAAHSMEDENHADTSSIRFIELLRLLTSKKNRISPKEAHILRLVLPSYLDYVNANIVLSNRLGVGFHDWSDFFPLYEHKFRYVGQTLSSAQQIECSHKLFEVAFPDLAIENTRGLLKALKDKRIEDLRRLVREAAAGKVQFDEEFARRTLFEVLASQRKGSRLRRIISYSTLPLSLLDFIGPFPGSGTVAQLAADEVIGSIAEKKLQDRYEWFYLLSDIAGERNQK